MSRRYRPFGSGRRAWRTSKPASARQSLSRAIGGIDKDIEQYFLNLSRAQLEVVLRRYGEENGAGALTYACETYSSWKSGYVKMSGRVAERLLELVPRVLDAATRFELVKKVRYAHLRKESRWVSCAPGDWRAKVAPAVAELLAASDKFQLPEAAVSRVRWLADGDSLAAQKLLAAAEQEEAVVRLAFLEAEFQRIDILIQNIQATKSVGHTIELPQGTVHVHIAIPEPPKKGFWGWLSDVLS
jgi:hypothetical protein